MAKEVFQLEVQVTTAPALSGLQNLNKELAKTKQGAADIGKENKLGSVKTSTDLLTTSMKGLSGILAAVGITKIATDAIQAIAAFQSLTVTLETVTGSVSKAAAQLSIIQSVSKSTGFSIADLGAASINLAANGITPSVERLKLFADVASVTADKVQTLTAISNLFARNNQGGLGLEDLNIIANAGVPVFDILAKKLNVSRLQIAQLGQTAEGAQLVLKTLSSELGDRFGGQSEKQLNTINGQFTQLTNNMNAFFLAMGKGGATEGLTDLLKSLSDINKDSQGTGETVGATIGNALKSLAQTIRDINAGWKIMKDNIGAVVIVLGVIAALIAGFFLLPEALAAIAAYFAELTLGGSTLAGIVTVIANVFSKALAPITAFISKLFTSFTWFQKLILLATTFLGIADSTGEAVRKIQDSKPFESTGLNLTKQLNPNAKDTAGGGRGVTGGASYEEVIVNQKKVAEEEEKGLQKALILLSNRNQIISKILNNLKEETKIIGMNKQQVEEENKIYEAQSQIRDALSKGLHKPKETEEDFQARITKEAAGLVDVAAIRSAVAAKHTAEQRFQFTEMVKNSQFEIDMLGKSGNEIERQTRLRAELVSIGKRDTATQKEKADILAVIDKELSAKQVNSMNELIKLNTYELSLIGKSANEVERQTKLREELNKIGKLNVATEQEKLDILKEIDKLQGAKTTQFLKDNLEGIRQETEYLKLGNMEREKRQALDSAATGAGFKNAADFAKARPEDAAAIRSATGEKVLTGINVEAQKQIDNLKEESYLLSIIDEQDRTRVKNQMDIYKAIDPEGKGKNITAEMKDQIGTLQATIEAQNKFLEVNKKIADSFTSLGDAVTKWKLGASGGIEQVRLELIKLIALQALKSFTGGSTNGLVGSFINGIIGGLSGKAEGGPVQAGTSYIVGEKRPEIFTPTQNGYIIPNTSMVNTSSGQTSNVTISPNLIIHGGVNGQRELDAAFEQFAGAMAMETQKLIIQQTGQGGILRAR